MKCLVSGATGFIGRYLCRELQGKGHSVTALSRSGAALPDGTPSVALDLADSAPDGDSVRLGQLLEGVEVVFHLAGIAHQHAPGVAYRELNYLATIRLARLAAAAGVKRFVFLSSVKAMGPPRDTSPRREADCVEPADAYGRSKWQAECALREEFSAGPMAVLVIRPALVYGPGAKGNLAILARAVKLGLPRPPPIGGRSMVALQDLVALLCAVGAAAPAGPGTWIVCDGRHYSTRYLYDLLRQASGKGVGMAWLPLWAWRLAATGLDLLTRQGADTTFDKLFGTELYSNAQVLADTRWRPGMTLGDAVVHRVSADGAGT